MAFNLNRLLICCGLFGRRTWRISFSQHRLNESPYFALCIRCELPVGQTFYHLFNRIGVPHRILCSEDGVKEACKDEPDTEVYKQVMVEGFVWLEKYVPCCVPT